MHWQVFEESHYWTEFAPFPPQIITRLSGALAHSNLLNVTLMGPVIQPNAANTIQELFLIGPYYH